MVDNSVGMGKLVGDLQVFVECMLSECEKRMPSFPTFDEIQAHQATQRYMCDWTTLLNNSYDVLSDLMVKKNRVKILVHEYLKSVPPVQARKDGETLNFYLQRIVDVEIFLRDKVDVVKQNIDAIRSIQTANYKYKEY